MQCRAKLPLLSLFFASVTFLCMLLVGEPSSTKADAVPRPTYTCIMSLSNPQLCSHNLSKGGDDRMVWDNDTGQPVYVCFDPDNSPFEAFAWKIPAHGKRNSGSIGQHVTPPAGKTLDFDWYKSPTFLLAAAARTQRKSKDNHRKLTARPFSQQPSQKTQTD